MSFPIRIACSPCPNDSFTLENLQNGNVRIENNEAGESTDNNQWFSFQIERRKINELNELALENSTLFDIIKVSTAILPQIVGNYSIIPTGISCSKTKGPSVLTTKDVTKATLNSKGIKIATAGATTTAHLLAKKFFPKADLIPYEFDKIEKAILDGEVHAGVFIHERQWSLIKQKPWKLIADLGQEWHNATNRPLPLGVYVISNRINLDTAKDLSSLFRESLVSKRNSREGISLENMLLAQDKDPNVQMKHIEKYLDPSTSEFNSPIGHALEEIFTLSNSSNFQRNGMMVQLP